MTEAKLESTELNEKPAPRAPLVEGSLWKAIWIMSWPLLLTTFGSSLVGMVDMAVAGRLGSAAQATVGISEQILFLFMVFFMCLSVGTTALVSRNFGAGNVEEAQRSTAQSLVLAGASGVVMAILAFFFSHYAILFLTSATDVVALGTQYLAIFSLFLIPFSINCIVNASFRAIGDAKTPLLVVLVSTTVQICGDYLTVVKGWPVPGLGIRGIAFSALCAHSCAASVGLFRLSRSPLKNSFKLLFPAHVETMKRVLRVGLPTAMQRLSWATSVFVVFFVLSHCPSPTAALASWTIGMRIEALIFMPMMALGMGVGAIVGQNLGAKEVERAFKAGWHVSWIGIWMMIVMATALFSFAHPLAKMMSSDPVTIDYTTWYLRINALGDPVLALGMIMSGALQGAGDTRAPMWITLLSHWGTRLPLAWFLSLTCNLGPLGTWIAMSASVIIMSALMTWRYQSRAWIKVEV